MKLQYEEDRPRAHLRPELLHGIEDPTCEMLNFDKYSNTVLENLDPNCTSTKNLMKLTPFDFINTKEAK